MSRKNVLVVLAHSSSKSYGTALGTAYIQSAERRGHSVRVLRINELAFDPVLHGGYGVKQDLESDLQSAQAAIRWAGHITLVYPIWWGSLPALLKGFIDRVFLPGFAFKYESGMTFPAQLLKGRSAHIIATMDTPPWYFRWIHLAPGIHQVKKATLEFCGVRPVKALTLGPILGSSPRRREKWLSAARTLAEQI